MSIQQWCCEQVSYTFDTSHGYPNSDFERGDKLSLTGAVGYAVTFSSSSWTESCCDPFSFFTASGTQLYTNRGSSWSPVYLSTAEGFYWEFRSDGSVTGWGVQFTVTPVCADGSYFNATASACMACPAGLASWGQTAQRTQSVCQPCPAGTFLLSGGACGSVPAGIVGVYLVNYR